MLSVYSQLANRHDAGRKLSGEVPEKREYDRTVVIGFSPATTESAKLRRSNLPGKQFDDMRL